MLSKLSNEDVGACGRGTHLRQRVEIDEMQCVFMLGCGTTYAIFIVHQLQEKHLIANKPLYMAFDTSRRKHLIVYIKISSGWQCPRLEQTSG